MSNKIMSYKGMNQDMTCRGFQYEQGKEYEEENAELCNSGFHACEYPLDCFRYYTPNDSRYFEVEQSGKVVKGDNKTVSSKIKIGAEIGIPGLVKAAIEYTTSRAKKGNSATGYCGASSATGDYGASSATGYCGASSATGYCGASSATGDYGASSATGYCGASSATGDYGASSATGNYGASSATGNYGASSATGNYGAAVTTGYKGVANAGNETAIAVAWGVESCAKGVKGATIVCAEWKWREGMNCYAQKATGLTVKQ